MVSYRVKVRGRKYLWCSEGIETVPSKLPLYLHIRVDENGEKIVFGKLTRVGQNETVDTDLGTLERGECFTINLSGVLGIYATLALPVDTFVDCYIIGSETI